jgi:hypothetical protein
MNTSSAPNSLARAETRAVPGGRVPETIGEVRNPTRTFRQRLHRVAGLLGALVLVHLVATGLPLQFTDVLGLGSRHVTSPVVLAHYGMTAPESAEASGGFVQIGEQVWFGDRLLAAPATLRGGVSGEPFAFALIDSSLVIVGEPDIAIERLPLPEGTSRIGRAGEYTVVDSAAGLLRLSDAWLAFEPVGRAPAAITWARTEALVGEQLAIKQTRYLGRLLTAQRLLQDLHSGRYFGRAGEWVVNVASMLFVVLAATGLWIWWKTRAR